MKSGAFIPSLTSLRFFAALLVYLFHVEIRAPFMPALLKASIATGYTGMVFFFVLSGFVLTLWYASDEIDYRRYIVARFARIYPAYLVACLINIPMLRGIDFGLLLFNAGASLLLMNAWFPGLFPLGINGGTWSLSVEFFFYLLFPIVIWLEQGKVRSERFSRTIIAALWVLSFTPAVAHLVAPAAGNPGFFYSVPIYRLAEFLLGIYLAMAWQRGHVEGSLLQVALAAVPFLVGAYLIDGGAVASLTLTLMNIVAVPFFAAVILFAATRRPAFLEHRWMVYLGEISYGLFIYQFVFLFFIFPRLLAWPLSAFATLLIGSIFLLIAATISWEFFERPLRDYIRKRFSSKSSIAR